MEDKKDVVVDTTDEQKSTEKTFTQDDVKNIVAKNVKDELGKVLKKLEVEDFDNVKTALTDYKKLQDAQKSDLEKTQEENTSLKDEVGQWKNKYQSKDLEIIVGNTLTELEVSSKHKEVLMRLIDSEKVINEDGEVNREGIKTQLEAIINDKLPMLKETNVSKVGVESTQQTPIVSSNKAYLDEKYKNNPYYEG